MAKRDTSAARAAAAAKRGGARDDARQRREDPDLRAKKPQARATWLAVLVAALAVLVVVMLSGATSGQSSRTKGLIPWTGAPNWRTRKGQFIDPEAAASLLRIAASVDCSPQPMTLDVSREGGGLYPPHVSHRDGADVDIRMSDLSSECRKVLQALLAAEGWRVWYDGPDAVAPETGGVHKSHLHARFTFPNIKES